MHAAIDVKPLIPVWDWFRADTDIAPIRDEDGAAAPFFMTAPVKTGVDTSEHEALLNNSLICSTKTLKTEALPPAIRWSDRRHHSSESTKFAHIPVDAIAKLAVARLAITSPANKASLAEARD